MDKLLLKPTEAAERLNIGRSLFYELIAQNKIPHVRLGRCIRVPAKSLEIWLAVNELGSGVYNSALGGHTATGEGS